MEKNKKLMILIIALLVVLLGVVITVSVVAYNMVNSASGEKEVVIENVSEVDFMQTALITLDEPLTINLLPDPDGTTHAVNLKVSVSIDASNKDDAALIEKIQGSQPIIKDAVNYVVSNKTKDQVAGNAAQDILKEEILLRLQDEFKTNIIYSVYFDGFYYM